MQIIKFKKKIKVNLAINSSFDNKYTTNSFFKQSTGRIATRRLSFFIRKGNKSGRERIFRDLVFKRIDTAPKKKNKYSLPFIFKSFFISATPFIGLKTRRRRKYIKHKLVPSDRSRGERKSLNVFSAQLHSHGAVSKPFVARLNAELESVADSYIKGKEKQKRNVRQVKKNTVSVQSNVSNTFREKRDEIHKLAYKSRPYR